MRQRSLWKKPLPYLLIVFTLAVATAPFLGPDLVKLDLTELPSRAGWQITNRVIESLGIEPGDQVADIGAGDGYFTFRFAESVGPKGTVYAVEVDDDLVETLERKARDEGYTNIVVVKGEYADPLLPDGQTDVIFLCHSYHHIKDRPEYFDRLRTDLSPRGRVAIVDLSPTPLIRLLAPSGHWTPIEAMREEMLAAHYQVQEAFDFLPGQSFSVFAPIRH